MVRICKTVALRFRERYGRLKYSRVKYRAAVIRPGGTSADCITAGWFISRLYYSWVVLQPPVLQQGVTLAGRSTAG